MRTAAMASSIQYVPTSVGNLRVSAAKKLFCILQFGAGCNSTSILALADILAAAGDVEGSAELIDFAYEYFDLEHEDRILFIEETFSDEIINGPSANKRDRYK